MSSTDSLQIHDRCSVPLPHTFQQYDGPDRNKLSGKLTRVQREMRGSAIGDISQHGLEHGQSVIEQAHAGMLLLDGDVGARQNVRADISDIDKSIIIAIAHYKTPHAIQPKDENEDQEASRKTVLFADIHPEGATGSRTGVGSDNNSSS